MGSGGFAARAQGAADRAVAHGHSSSGGSGNQSSAGQQQSGKTW